MMSVSPNTLPISETEKPLDVNIGNKAEIKVRGCILSMIGFAFHSARSPTQFLHTLPLHILKSK